MKGPQPPVEIDCGNFIGGCLHSQLELYRGLRRETTQTLTDFFA